MSTSLANSMSIMSTNLMSTMSTSLSTKLYLKQRMNELMIYEVSDLMVYLNTFKQVIGDKVLVDLIKIKDENNDMALLCSLPPLLTALKCIKEPLSLSLSSPLLTGLHVNHNRNSYGYEEERWLEVISWEPKAFVYHNFLTNEECEHLISLAKPHLVRSRVYDTINKVSKISSTRTSNGAIIRKGHDQIVKDIEKRISDFTFIPLDNGEGLQVIHYEVGQQVGPHYDGFQRMATVLMYLSDVEEGGETVFPLAKENNRAQKVTVSPKKRDAVLFYNMRPDGSVDPASQHSGRPVIKGDKWAVTKWFHVGEYKPTYTKKI